MGNRKSLLLLRSRPMDSSRLKKQTVNPAPGQAPTEPAEPHVSLQNATWASGLFLAGSLALVVDATLASLAEVTLSSGLHLGGSLLFSMGSLLLVPRRPRSAGQPRLAIAKISQRLLSKGNRRL